MTDQSGNRIKDNSLWWSFLYLALGSGYILASDLWLFRSDAHPEQRLISIAKGLVYVLVTAVLLYAMMRQNTKTLRQAATRLMESDARLRRIFDTAEEGLVVVDGKGTITDVNQRMCEILERPASRIVGTPFGELLAPESRALLLEQLGSAPAGKRRAADVELCAAGSPAWYRAAWNGFDDADERRFVFLLTDISDRIQREREVASQNAELERRVKDRTAKLQLLNKELAAFSYSVSHDLREPIRAANGLTAILIEDYRTSLPPEAQEILDRIRYNLSRMNAMIESLLKLSRLTSAAHRVERTSLTELARRAFAEAVPEEDRKRVEFVVQDGLEAECDASLMEIALTNLIRNAWKFNREREGLRIEFGVEEIDGAPAYFVRDNGVGFRSEAAEEVFEPFNRLSREVEGEGIGLATVRRIVTRHNGRVWAKSAPGQGACFWFTLNDSGV